MRSPPTQMPERTEEQVRHCSDQGLERLQDRLQYRFSDLNLLRQAMVHRSYLNEADEPGLESNERLEFLGDAVLDAVVARRLYLDYPDAGEGWLTVARSQLVRNDALGQVGRALGLGEFLLLGAGVHNEGARENLRVLSRALEATLGAVWLDGGEEAVTRVIFHLLRSNFESLPSARTHQDAKSRLQELAQSRSGAKPTYTIIRESGPPHDRWYRAAVEIDGQSLAEGEGRSKQAAELDAACRALRALQDESA